MRGKITLSSSERSYTPSSKPTAPWPAYPNRCWTFSPIRYSTTRSVPRISGNSGLLRVEVWQFVAAAHLGYSCARHSANERAEAPTDSQALIGPRLSRSEASGRREHFCADGERGLGGRRSREVEPDRAVDARDLGAAQPEARERLRPAGLRAPRAEGADVA